MKNWKKKNGNFENKIQEISIIFLPRNFFKKVHKNRQKKFEKKSPTFNDQKLYKKFKMFPFVISILRIFSIHKKKVFSHGRINSVEPKQFGSKISAEKNRTFSSSSSPLLKLMRRKKEFPSNKAVYGKECRRISSSPKRIILKLRFYCFTRFILPCEKTFIWIEKNLQNWNKKRNTIQAI